MTAHQTRSETGVIFLRSSPCLVQSALPPPVPAGRSAGRPEPAASDKAGTPCYARPDGPGADPAPSFLKIYYPEKCLCIPKREVFFSNLF